VISSRKGAAELKLLGAIATFFRFFDFEAFHMESYPILCLPFVPLPLVPGEPFTLISLTSVPSPQMTLSFSSDEAYRSKSNPHFPFSFFLFSPPPREDETFFQFVPDNMFF